MSDQSMIVVAFAITLMAIDITNAFFAFKMSRRVAALEGRTYVDGGTCATCRSTIVTNAEALGLLTVIVSRHTEEIALMRRISNDRQVEIINAIHGIHDDVMGSIEKRIMPRATLEAALRDLYNRTTARDPDAEPRVDADVPIP